MGAVYDVDADPKELETLVNIDKTAIYHTLELSTIIKKKRTAGTSRYLYYVVDYFSSSLITIKWSVYHK